MRSVVYLAACCAACGRVNFDPLGAASDGSLFDAVVIDGRTTVVIDSPAQIRDTSIWDLYPDVNFGTVDHVAVDATERALYWFDLSAIPTTATVISATLRLTTWDAVSNGGTIEVYPMLEAWEVGTMNGTAGICNWMERMPGVPWSTPGALPPSRSTTVIGSASPTLFEQTLTIALSPSAISDWVSKPAENFGITIGQGTAVGHLHLHSLEGGPGPRLELEVE